VNWVYRPNSEDCSGAYASAGSLFGTFGTGWLPSLADAVITVGGEWRQQAPLKSARGAQEHERPDFNSGTSATSTTFPCAP
jgi:hypothetical protein